MPAPPQFRTRFQFGTVPKLNRERGAFTHTDFLLQASSRTLVTNFSGFPRYRFWGASPAQSLHALAASQPPTSQKLYAPYDVITHLFDRRITNFVGGHPGSVASRHGGHLLLPMCGITRAPKLRQDVRNTEVFFPALGEELRKAAPAHPH